MKHRTLNWLFVGWFRPYTNGMGYFLKLVWVFPCPSHHPQQIPEKAVKSHFTLGVKIKSFLHHLSHLHSNYGWIRACHTLRGGVPKFSLEKCGMSIYCSYVGSGLGIVLRWDAVTTSDVIPPLNNMGTIPSKKRPIVSQFIGHIATISGVYFNFSFYFTKYFPRKPPPRVQPMS